jgi:hypothetical protein
MVFDTGKRNVAILGLSFRAAPLKLGMTTCLWVGSLVPIGSTSSRRSRTLDRSWENDLGQMLKNAEVVAIETRGISRDQLQPHYGPITSCSTW